MKKVLGLDIGTNSIGWALVNLDFDNAEGEIINIGSRIVPMDADLIKDFEAGNSISKTRARTMTRGARRLKQRYKLRRERLIKTMKILGWLSDEFPENFDGLIKHNINDYLPFSKTAIEECAQYLNIDKTNLPNDWVIYYLRKKALKENIEIKELARILYHFNQRRGFKSNRKANDEITLDIEDLQSEKEKPKSEKRIEILNISSVIDTGEIVKGKKVYKLITNKEITDGLFEGYIQRHSYPDWQGKEQELEVRIKRNKEGTKIEFALPDKSQWKEAKEALESDIKNSGLHPGEYFIEQLKNNPNYRIRQRVVDRNFYKNELTDIWKAQTKFHNELKNTKHLDKIAHALYQNNKEKQKELKANDLLHVFLNDIIYYQRDLKSQRSSVGECRFEKKNVTLKDNKGIEYQPALKAAPVSCPLFQKFRIWKTIHNIRIIALQKNVNNKVLTDVDETNKFLNFEKKAELFDEFDSKEQIKPSAILKFLNLSPSQYKLNYPNETELPGNETKHFFRKAFKKLDYDDGLELLNDDNTFNELWHLYYSVENFDAIANSLIKRFSVPEKIAKQLSKLPPFTSRYTVYSQKALSKLIEVMRCGKYWSYDNISKETKNRIEKLITAEDDPEVNIQTREKLKELNNEEQFQGLPEWMATYVVYGTHSEKGVKQVDHPEQIQSPVQNTLRNPIVEQIVNETMQLTKDIWKKHGKPDEIRVEMARDMKRTAKERDNISKIRDKNRVDKLRIKAILQELNIGNPNSPGDIEKLRLLEENGNFAWKNSKEKFFSKQTEPTKTEIEKYRLWVEQNCVSPYTGKPIMLSKLFTREYEVEHIMPRSRFFDDSFGNKVIVETWANEEKGNLTAMQYIRRGSSKGRLLSVEDYVSHVNKVFFKKKRKHLLSDKIPEDSFIQRQLNDTRYITKQVNKYLAQIVRDDKVNITIGEITNELKVKWGLNELMKKILIPRFERLEQITGEKFITYETNEQGQRKIHLEGNDKRIDHRHHALDALITACTTQSHVQYLNNLNAQTDDSTRFKFGKILNSSKVRDFRLPWKTFIPDAHKALESIIVSHKNRNRILNKSVNRYYKFVNLNGKWVKRLITQNNENLYAIRQQLHKDTFAGKIRLREYKNVNIKEAIQNIDYVADKRVKNSLKQLIKETGDDLKKIKKEIKENPLIDKKNNKVEGKITIWYFKEYAVNRVELDESFTEKKIKEKIAEYDTNKEKGLKNLLLKHLEEHNNKPKEAFTGEGLEALWKKTKRPVTTVSIYEPIGKKFQIRPDKTPNQYVEAAKGTNLFFVIYENIHTGERDFETLNFLEVVTAKMEKLPVVKPREGYNHFTLSPNDLVYVPDQDENIDLIDWDKDKERISKRIYKMVKSPTDNQCYFIPHNIANLVIPYDSKTKIGEFGSQNCSEKSLDDLIIKRHCVKLKHDRMGNVKPA